MKKVFAFGLVAVALLLANRQQASAWSKFNFGVGMNICCEKSNTSVLWGAFKTGPGGPGDVDGGFQGGYPAGPGYDPAQPAPPLAPIPPQGLPTKPANYAQPVSYNNYQYYQAPSGYNPYWAPQPAYYPYAYPSYGYSGWNGW